MSNQDYHHHGFHYYQQPQDYYQQPQDLPPLVNPQPFLPPAAPVQIAPIRYLVQPTAAPAQPAVVLDQERLKLRFEGFIVAVILIFTLLFCGKGFVFWGMAAAGVYFYYGWSGNIARFRMEEEPRWPALGHMHCEQQYSLILPSGVPF